MSKYEELQNTKWYRNSILQVAADAKGMINLGDKKVNKERHIKEIDAKIKQLKKEMD